jgi:hypothetical protein
MIHARVCELRVQFTTGWTKKPLKQNKTKNRSGYNTRDRAARYGFNLRRHRKHAMFTFYDRTWWKRFKTGTTKYRPRFVSGKKATPIPPSVNMTNYGAEKHPLPPQVVQRSERERAPKLRIWQSIRFQNIRWHKGEWKKTTIVLAPPASWRDASFQNSKDSATVTFRLGIWRSYVFFFLFFRPFCEKIEPPFLLSCGVDFSDRGESIQKAALLSNTLLGLWFR